MLKNALHLHQIGFMEFQADVPELRVLLLYPHDFTVQQEWGGTIRKLNEQGNIVVFKYPVPGRDLDPLGRGIAQENIHAVIFPGMVVFHRKTGRKTFKNSSFHLRYFIHKINYFKVFQFASGQELL